MPLVANATLSSLTTKCATRIFFYKKLVYKKPTSRASKFKKTYTSNPIARKKPFIYFLLLNAESYTAILLELVCF